MFKNGFMWFDILKVQEEFGVLKHSWNQGSNSIISCEFISIPWFYSILVHMLTSFSGFWRWSLTLQVEVFLLSFPSPGEEKGPLL